MKPPKKAFILAAGLGTRLRPLTFYTPKPLIPVWGRPILHHTLHTLKRWGVREVVINVHQHLDAFRAVAHEARELQLTIEFSYEPVVLDTGGALRKAHWFFDQEPFWLINGDIVFDVDPQPLLKAFGTAPSPLSVLWCTDQFGPRTVELVWPGNRHNRSGSPARVTPQTDGESGRVSSFRSDKPGSLGTYTFCGIHLLSPAILDFIPRSEPQSIIAAYTQAMAKGLTILGVTPRRHYWADLGTLESYLAAHNHIHRAVHQSLPGSDLVHPAVWKSSRRFSRAANGIVVVPPDVNIPHDSNLSNTIIWPGSHMGPGTTVRNAVIAGASLEGPVDASGAILPLEKAGFPTHLSQALYKLNFKPHSTVIPFPPRGSARSFYRIRDKHLSAVLIRYETIRAENTLHASHTRFLTHAGIPVPRLLADEPINQWCMMEDCGDTSLLSLYPQVSPATRTRLYMRVLDNVAQWHSPRVVSRVSRDRIRLAPRFTPSLYRWEHDLFIKHMAAPRLATNSPIIKSIHRELTRIASRLQHEPVCLLHRDLQSSNILFVRNQPIFIDYQGMRLGAAVYDLASLLADPYVSLSESMQESLLAYYSRRTRRSLSTLEPLFWMAVVQRLCQALGAYGRLAGLGLTTFSAHVRPALIMLDRALGRTDNEPVLKSFVSNELRSSAQKG